MVDVVDGMTHSTCHCCAGRLLRLLHHIGRMGNSLVIGGRLNQWHRLVDRRGDHLLVPSGHLHGASGVRLLRCALCHLHGQRLKLVVARLNEHLRLSIGRLAAKEDGLSIGGDQLRLRLINGTGRPGDARVE